MFVKILAIAVCLFGLAYAGVEYNIPNYGGYGIGYGALGRGYGGYASYSGHGTATSYISVNRAPVYDGAYSGANLGGLGGYNGYSGLGYAGYNVLRSAVSNAYNNGAYGGYHNGAYGGYGYNKAW